MSHNTVEMHHSSKLLKLRSHKMILLTLDTLMCIWHWTLSNRCNYHRLKSIVMLGNTVEMHHSSKLPKLRPPKTIVLTLDMHQDQFKNVFYFSTFYSSKNWFGWFTQIIWYIPSLTIFKCSEIAIIVKIHQLSKDIRLNMLKWYNNDNNKK